MMCGAMGCGRARSGSGSDPWANYELTSGVPAPQGGGAPTPWLLPVQPGIVESVADTWCAQEASCEQVGPGRLYATFPDCLGQTRAQVRSDLQLLDCQPSIDPSRARMCRDEIEPLDCERRVGSPILLAQCRTNVLCQPLGPMD
jgi:hypothetical protein